MGLWLCSLFSIEFSVLRLYSHQHFLTLFFPFLVKLTSLGTSLFNRPSPSPLDLVLVAIGSGSLGIYYSFFRTLCLDLLPFALFLLDFYFSGLSLSAGLILRVTFLPFFLPLLLDGSLSDDDSEDSDLFSNWLCNFLFPLFLFLRLLLVDFDLSFDDLFETEVFYAASDSSSLDHLWIYS